MTQYKKLYVKQLNMSSAIRRPFCLDLNVLNRIHSSGEMLLTHPQLSIWGCLLLIVLTYDNVRCLCGQLSRRVKCKLWIDPTLTKSLLSRNSSLETKVSLVANWSWVIVLSDVMRFERCQTISLSSTFYSTSKWQWYQPCFTWMNILPFCCNDINRSIYK